ncbi:GNAT family N-acetyltransferase [Vibrio fluvialis]|uniref:GNAT family N-acetyltransferase n=1 Tax=Vibrio fluvialis TaxID=676 RepID=UPI0006E1A18B|nr:GNAT family N-acetyltransferase [Vibrio fluvialis]EKO3372726.1 GNAT family N-acetyltransferase [Vibrio fluvialis]EKO3382168.1 GNAT family N-acetyltransferase [Vibrio fluvialis]EKO3410941.1 GNAT family N-acetyltransferase [Vibrio fluvialis]EKO3520735.1 GNAT family N-acetyltransferase [Vibrio fluvialis]EKO3526018.1 GNAT family N-acetyltransferase [Vibrio fluvialis]
MEIAVDNLQGSGVVRLLEEHLADMYATSPPESVHALDVEALKHPSITFWAAKDDGEVLGCVALKELDAQHGEIKSMRTSSAARNRGVASQLLSHLINEAKVRGYQKLSLETGSETFFIPARMLYEKNGFRYCEPFANYQPDPNSKFMTRDLVDK